ncbi:MAG: asparagine synthase (glutamine-hydrolyzing) [Candidatus Cloacimonetes bacterium]|nr:asparagine synthase (glutamine-hydrolyzing) [Candidatus Cloacimonadota bacterium]
MSAITGLFSFNNIDIPGERIIAKMTDIMLHRGPDGLGYYHGNRCYLGSAMLNITQQTGTLPLSVDDDRYTIVYDGAIYNYQQIRCQLEKEGHVFKNRFDAEVILRGYISWGPDILQKLNGIFSFAIWDSKDSSLFLSIDFKGFIPLYYTMTKDVFMFSSGINAIFASGLVRKVVNSDAIFEFLCRSHPPHPETMYEGIYKLQPGTWMKIDKSGHSENESYFSLENDWRRIGPLPKEEKALSALLKDKIRECVNRQLVSDVLVGMALSGGIDSALVFKFMSESFAKPLHAFTYANSVAEINEAERAAAIVRSIKRRTHHHILPVTYHDTRKLFDKTCRLLDLPETLFKYTIPFMLLCQLAFDKGIKVLLTGNGSDSLFMGYDRYRRWLDYGLLHNKNIGDWAEHFYFGGGIDKVKRVELLTGQSRDIAKESLVYQWVFEHQDLAPLKRMALFDQKFHPAIPVGGANRATAVQVRFPLVDKELVSWINAMDDSYKINGSQMKYILRQVANGILPMQIINAPKSGSPVDVMFWVNTPEFTSDLMDLVSIKDSFSRTYLCFDEVQKLICEHEKGYQFSHLCWCLYSLERWHSTSF